MTLDHRMAFSLVLFILSWLVSTKLSMLSLDKALARLNHALSKRDGELAQAEK
jgi:hypothetical protein